MSTKDDRKKKPVVRVARSEYQPKKEEAVVIDASPEEMLRVVVREVDLKLIDPKKKGGRKAGG